jgi:2-succinyl-5-enolpyruvyl-6-hydroxy-3-cyclohexene-1-carboxylate synthase
MISTKKQVQQLAYILHKKGICNIVISPGSRNSALISTFSGCDLFSCYSVVDERSAAYFALGVAQATKKPVAIVCSSGTATLNYAPAMAEAFYQNIPLIAITADRPAYWIDQNDNQCINQQGIFKNFIAKEFCLPLEETEQQLWFANRQINECLSVAILKSKPVHFNVPLEEPLHNLTEDKLPEAKIIDIEKPEIQLYSETLSNLANQINKTEKILIVAGQQHTDNKLETNLATFAKKAGAIVLKEHLSNINDDTFIGNIDLSIAAISKEAITDFQPDLLITFGGQTVSKSLKLFLRANKPAQHWHISPANEHFDTYQSLTKVLQTEPRYFFKQILSEIKEKKAAFQPRWKELEKQVIELRNKYISKITFSDLTVFSALTRAIPPDSVLHLGNSSPVRYAVMSDFSKNLGFYSNRGTSGIDGCLSTAVGFASTSNKINTIIVGDLSFFYDSNALWNNYIDKNLRIIVINNGGGNIFELINGPSDSPAFNKHFFAKNKFKAEGIAKTFGLDYLKAENQKEVEEQLNELYFQDRKTPTLLEIFTLAETNTKTYNGLFDCLKSLSKK